MDYVDKTLTCLDCGAEFTFSASEQEFFASKGFTNEPGRCPDCRAAGGKCTRPFAPLAAKTAKYRSSPETVDLSTARTATVRLSGSQKKRAVNY